jgi:hypothetical protein
VARSRRKGRAQQAAHGAGLRRALGAAADAALIADISASPGRRQRSRARRSQALRCMRGAAGRGGRFVPWRFPARLQPARQRVVRGMGADPARTTASTGAGGARRARRRLRATAAGSGAVA